MLYLLVTSEIQRDGIIRAGTLIFEFEVLMVRPNCTDFTYGNPEHCMITLFAVRAMLSPCAHIYDNVSFSRSIFEKHILSKTILPQNSMGYGLAGNFSSFPGVDCSASITPQGNKTQPTGILTSYLNREPDLRCLNTYCGTDGIDFYGMTPHVYSISTL